METMNTGNETTQKLEELRKARLKEAYQKQKGKVEEPKKEESEENVKNSEEKLDNDEKNSYIDKDGTNEKESKYQELFEKQFKGDPLKAIKSWSETQSEYMKLRNSVKKDQEYLDKLSEVVEKNPLLQEVLDKAEKNEDIESFLATKFSESQQSDKPNSSQKSKPNVTETDIKEKDLIESGYIDPSEKEFLNAEEWSDRVRQASIRFMYNELPNRMAKSAAERYKEQIEEVEKERRLEQQRKQNEDLITQRYLNGIEKISTEYGLDFVGNEEHKELLSEIEKRAAGIPDINNPQVIDEDAVEIATDYVLKKRGLIDQLRQEKPKSPNKEEMFDRNQFNVNKRSESSNKPKSVADRLRQKHLENYQVGLQQQVVSKSEN